MRDPLPADFRKFHLSRPVRHRAALFLTAWVIYLADRFADSVSLITEQPKSMRQQFCLRHKSIWLVSIICVAAVDFVVVLRAVNYETAVLRRGSGSIYRCLSYDQSRAQRNLGDNSAEGIHHRLIVCRRHFARRNASYFCGTIDNDFRGDSLRHTLLAELCQHCDLGTGSRSDSRQAFTRDVLGACEFSLGCSCSSCWQVLLCSPCSILAPGQSCSVSEQAGFC